MTDRANPQQYVSTTEELIAVRYKYGPFADRLGFRMENKPSMVSQMLATSMCSYADDELYAQRCGPFKVDFYTSPIMFPEREQDISDLPPR